MRHDLDRSVDEQQRTYGRVIDELRRGQQPGHGIWFVLPQIAGLGSSEMSQRGSRRSADPRPPARSPVPWDSPVKMSPAIGLAGLTLCP
jgi:hypothetical protein